MKHTFQRFAIIIVYKVAHIKYTHTNKTNIIIIIIIIENL